MRTVPTDVFGAMQNMHGSDPYATLLQIIVSESTSAKEVFQLTNYAAEIVYPAGSSPTADYTYTPYPFTLSVQREDNQGGLPTVELSLSNISRTVVPYLFIADNLLGKKVNLWHVNQAHLDSGDEIETTELSIAGASVTASTIGLRLELPSFHDVQLPMEIYQRDRCDARFGGTTCGFVITATSLQDCDKTITDCTARGDEEEADGRPRRHPMRFRGFPGLPRKVRA